MNPRFNGSGCPDPNALAAFSEGTASDELRDQVARHLADCSRCVAIVGATVEFLRAHRETTRPIRWVAMAATVAIVALVGIFWTTRANDPLRRIRRLAATESTRPVEGRLAYVPYAPFLESRSAASAPLSVAVQAEAERIARSAKRNARRRHAQGIALLITGNAPQAVLVLAAAAEDDATNAMVWNDLAVAWIAHAVRGDRRDFQHAIDAAGHAIAVAPDTAAAYFNRGLALEHLDRRAEAATAYEAAYALERDERWRREIEERLGRLRQ